MKCDPIVFKDPLNDYENKSADWEVTKIGYH
jgi:hypothetical protein